MKFSRVVGAALCVVLASLTGILFSRERATTDGADSFYPVAVWYGGGKARAPMLERLDATSAARWGKDLDVIKAAGFNTVKTWMDWATAEPRAGEFSFANLDLLLRLAQERGLRVIIQVYLDSAPDWVGVKYPDGRFVDRSGAVIQSQSAPGFCIDHAGVRKEVTKFLEALSRDANLSPALYGWDVWSEPHVINWAEFPSLVNAEFCYCDSSQARFREWVKSKYETLAALNAAWYRNFESWEQVAPPRFPTILSYTDYLDWRAFIDDKLAGDLKTRVAAIRQADAVHAVTSHAAVPGLFTSPTDGYGNPDDWKMSAGGDFFGTSLYPKHSESTRPWSYAMLAAGLDFTRSAGRSFGKGFWIGELQAGQGATGMRIADPVTPQEEELWMWEAVAHGAREIAIYAWYPMSSGFESNGYGLIHLDGSLTDRAQAAGNVARIIARHGAEILSAKPAPAQVAILYNRLSYMVGGSQPSLSKLGNAERDSLMGLHRAFSELQIPVDFVDPEDVIQNKLGQYKILFLAFPVMISKDLADGVSRYVRNGGTAVAEARLAWNDERGFASEVIPGFGLAEVFGAREKIIRPVENPALTMEVSPELPGLAASLTVGGEAFEEHLEPLPGAHVLGRFASGEAAVVERTLGKGKAVLVGSFLAMAYQRRHEEATRRLLTSLAQAAGGDSEVEVSGSGISEMEVRRLVSDQRQIVFAFNHSKDPANATLSLHLPWQLRKARDLVKDSAVEFQAKDGRFLFQGKIPENGIWILELESQ
jgi:beta-galactosidase